MLLGGLVVAVAMQRQAHPFESTWDRVCKTEEARARHATRTAQTSLADKRRYGTALPNGTLLVYVEGKASVPMSAVDGAVLKAEIEGPGYVTMRITPKKLNPNMTCTSHGVDYRVQPKMRQARLTYYSTAETCASKHQCRRPTATGVRVLACSADHQVVADFRRTVIVIPPGGGTCGRSNKAPERNSAEVLTRLANGEPMTSGLEAALQDATRRLEAGLMSRGAVCDGDCTVRPVPCRPCVAKMDDCLFARNNTKHKYCLEICVSQLTADTIGQAEYNWETHQTANRCLVLHVHGLAVWYAEHRYSAPFLAHEDLVESTKLNEWYHRVAGISDMDHLPSRRDLPLGQAYDRCAVLGSGHTLRCSRRAWGPVIDTEYDVIFRVNKRPLSPSIHTEFKCAAGRRADFVVNVATSDHLLGRIDRTDLAVRKRYINTHKQFVEDVIALQVAGASAVQKDPLRLESAARMRVYFHQPIPSLLPAKAALSRGLGSGSGSTALSLAISLCRHVDFFGFGIYRSPPPLHFAYLHYYQPAPTSNMSAPGGEDILRSELRNAIFDAFGVANFIWW